MHEVMEFWCFLDLSLADAFERFRFVFPVVNFIHDSENVWEWIDGRCADGSVGFNISRAHAEKHSSPDDPIRLSLSVAHGFQLSRDEIGRRLADALRIEVFTGSVEYVAGDDFRYTVEESFQPT